ncbi:hypothetical protein BUALT_BualtUnG0033800 [Buddleja alternifolia]|uniref:Late embryogenesis abundant protein LEA-2 subgroup domain-containing protein n=1 Tax=Buddleja alternifolia TaxID=168488 RepID=A0AAV6W3S8_9LAMI|nr:hypothetical protein BUALT_BualtUnG0033800 [Buddleja alternifolia]
MSRHRENNPHFLPRNNNDPVIEFVPPTPRPRSRPPYWPHPRPPPQSPPKPLPPHQVELPPHQMELPPHQVEMPPHQVEMPPHQDSKPHPISDQDSHQQPRRGHRPTQYGHVGPQSHHDQSPFLRAPPSRRTRPLAWLVAAFCALFWIIIIVGGLIILIVYLVFRPRNPRFDISTATLNAAYLDMGYLLNADVTVLANFTNPNTKVNVDFSYAILDLYYERNPIATRYIYPFTVRRRQTRFADVHLVASQVRLSREQSMGLQRQMDNGRVQFEIRGLFKARSRLGGFLRYTYWLNVHCEIVVTGPPTGVLIGKKCVTKR